MSKWMIEINGNAINLDCFAELIVCMTEKGDWTVRGQYLDNRSIELCKRKSEKDAKQFIEDALTSK